ncbi:MAG: hypothetical protein WD208_02195 [Dehalococcoidia bacterium]
MGVPAAFGEVPGAAVHAPAHKWSPPDPKYPKLAPQLNALVEQQGAASHETASQTLLFHEGSVGVMILLKENSNQITTFLEQGGGWVNHAWDSLMEAYVPVDLLPDLAERPEILGVMAMTRPREGRSGQGPTVGGRSKHRAGGHCSRCCSG